MQTKTIVCTAIVLFLALVLSGPGQQSAEKLYKSGLYAEEVSGDLQKAIGIYQDILERFPENREIAAKSLLHIGICYEKLGTREAEKAFQRVINDFPEQSEAVKLARERLSAITRAVSSPKPPVFSTRQVWSGQGVDTMGAVSPDGRYLCFVDWETGDLAVRNLTSGTNRRLTNKGTWEQSSEFAMYAKWSRDGRRIAYQWYGKDDILELRVYDTADSSIRTIVRDKSNQDWAQAFDWSPDGSRVLVAFWEAATPTQLGRGRLGLVSVSDGSARMLRGHFETLSVYNFGWGFCLSPDGRYVVYNAPRSYEESGSDDIFLISLVDGKEERLVEHPAYDKVVGWTPKGDGLLFTSDRTGSEDLYLLPLNNGKPQAGPQMIKSGIGTIDPLGITQDGALYYGVGGGRADIYIANIEGGEGTVPFRKLALPYQGQNMMPDFAPDGDRVAYISIPPGRGQILGIASLQTGQTRQLRLELPMFMSPRWIPPDGRFLSVVGRDKDGISVLCMVDVQTGKLSPVFSLDKGWSFQDRPVWSPEGKRVYYACGPSAEKSRSIYVFDLETGRSNRLTGSPDDVQAIAVSPNGKWLAVINNQGRRSLRIVQVSGGEPREIHGFEHPDIALITMAWTGDSQGIYIAKTKDSEKNISDIYEVSLNGKDLKKIELGVGRIRFLSVRPGKREIALDSYDKDMRTNEVWVMENFLPTAKKGK